MYIIRNKLRKSNSSRRRNIKFRKWYWYKYSKKKFNKTNRIKQEKRRITSIITTRKIDSIIETYWKKRFNNNRLKETRYEKNWRILLWLRCIKFRRSKEIIKEFQEIRGSINIKWKIYNEWNKIWWKSCIQRKNSSKKKLMRYIDRYIYIYY